MQSGTSEQRQELSGLIKRDEIIATTNVGAADVDLRHCAPAGFFHHFGTLRRVEVNPYFFNFGYATGAQQLLGAHAVGANGGRIHQNTRCGTRIPVRCIVHFLAPFLIGMPA